MKKSLFSFYEELDNLGFDKRKAQGLVKRANNAGYDVYYAYHEDEADTWRNGWSSSDYKKDDDDVTLFEATELIGKKKPTFRSFTKAQTYTAECAIFIFCPLSTLLADPTLREKKINEVKSKAAKYAEADYQRAIEAKEKFDKWQNLPVEYKAEIKRLDDEINAILGQPGSRGAKGEKRARIAELGGLFHPLAAWQEKALSFGNLEKYIEFKKEEAVKRLLSENGTS